MTKETIARYLLAAVMVSAGITHFLVPAPFIKIVPAFLPNPAALVAISGVFEILGGIGILVPLSRKFSSIGLIALYLSVFPANINMALHPELFPQVPAILDWARLPFQILFIWWAWWVGFGPKADS